MNFFQKAFAHRYTATLFFWILILCVSFFSGFVGGAVTQQTISNFEVRTILEPKIISNIQRNPYDTNSLFKETLTQIGMRMFEIYDDGIRAVQDKNEERFPLATSFRGYALALTTDGWLVTTVALPKPLKSYRLVSETGSWYAVKDALSDQLRGVTFVKVDAKNLRPIQFVLNADSVDVSSALLVTSWHAIEQRPATTPWYADPQIAADYVHSSDIIDKRIRVHDKFDIDCMPLVTRTQEVIGCTSSAGGIVSFQYLGTALESILRTGSTYHPALNIRYIDLAQALSTNGRSSDVSQFGAVVGHAVTITTVSSGSATLKEGDVITHVNDDALDAQHNLSEVLARYQKGDTLILKVRTRADTRDITIKY